MICEIVSSAADFLSRMQMDPNSGVQIKIEDHVPSREKQIGTKAEELDMSLSNIVETNRFL